jgi:hypothetical protein
MPILIFAISHYFQMLSHAFIIHFHFATDALDYIIAMPFFSQITPPLYYAIIDAIVDDIFRHTLTLTLSCRHTPPLLRYFRHYFILP